MSGLDVLSLQCMMDMVGLHVLIICEISFISLLLEMKTFQRILKLQLKMVLQKQKRYSWSGLINKVDLMKTLLREVERVLLLCLLWLIPAMLLMLEIVEQLCLLMVEKKYYFYPKIINQKMKLKLKEWKKMADKFIKIKVMFLILLLIMLVEFR